MNLNKTQKPQLNIGAISGNLNHFQFHGSIIYDERRIILEEATYEPKIVKHELYTDGSFVKERGENSTTFFHNGKLYYFITTHHGAISNFFELNTSKEKCIGGQYGVYYEVV